MYINRPDRQIIITQQHQQEQDQKARQHLTKKICTYYTQERAEELLLAIRVPVRVLLLLFCSQDITEPDLCTACSFKMHKYEYNKITPIGLPVDKLAFFLR